MEDSRFLRAVVRTILAAGATVAAPTAIAQSNCSGCYVVVTAPSPSLGYGGAGGGSGGGYDGNSLPSWCQDAGCNERSMSYCEYLRFNKPEGCEGPQPVSGAEFGFARYAWQSGLDMAVKSSRADGNSPATTLLPEARASLASALNRHTAAIASQTTPVNVANRVLLQDIALVCDYQDTFDGYTNQSAAWKACWNMYRRIFDEATANGDISDVVISDAGKYGWALSDFFPQTVIN